MKFKSILTIIFLSFIFSNSNNSQTKLLIRCDDTGMCHSVNLAAKKLIETGIPFSTSVMFVCPWYKEAVDILKDNPQVSAGVHLTLNSEWADYKWSPVAGNKVPSLVDENGHFFESEQDFKNSGYKLEEVEIELRAQIERGIKSGLKIEYLDAHMLTATSTPELKKIVKKLADEYQLGISHFFGEKDYSIWGVDPEDKLTKLTEILNNLDENKLNLVVIHLGLDSKEMEGLIDKNTPEDPYRAGIHRQAELDALCSGIFKKSLKKNNIKLINYRELIDNKGLKVMKDPSEYKLNY